MSMWQRISLIFRSKANKALDRAEDPRETLDYSYQRQLDLLSKVRRGGGGRGASRQSAAGPGPPARAAAEAQTRINEAMSGIGEEMGDVGLAIQRAEDKTAQMQARASAVDELIASGALDDASAISRGDDITRELEAMS